MAELSPEQLKILCENDLYFLTREILGYKDLEEEPHLKICSFIQGKENKKLLLLPRGSFKSTIGTIANCIQRILKNPDIRILIASETLGQSIKFLKEIRGHLEQNATLKALYGTFQADLGWKETEITIAQRKKNLKEPTISTAGIDVVRTGAHVDFMVIDDPCSQKNTATREQILQTIDWYKLLFSILEPTGETLIIGTRWDFSDLYAHIVENFSDEYSIHIDQAIRDDGSLFFPSRLTKSFLDNQRREQGLFIFSAQYLNSPISSENATFRPHWFNKRFKEEDLKGKDLRTTITIDVADSKNQGSDYTGVIVNSVDKNDDWYLRHVKRYKFNSTELVEFIFDSWLMWKRHHLVAIGVEKNAFEDQIKPLLDKEMRQRQVYPNVIALKHMGSRKEDRIKGALVPRFEYGRIFLRAEEEITDDTRELIDEALRFPKSRFDDLLDAAAHQSAVAFAPKGFMKEMTDEASEFFRRKKKKEVRSYVHSI